MKKIILIVLLAALARLSNAQVIIDTVSLGAGYANQKWYSLENDEQGSAAKNNWDLAFDVSGFGSSIHINSINGILLWKYPTAAAGSTNFTNVDTAGLSTWPKLYNTDTSWAFGAFDRNMNTSNPLDLGWGIYSTTTHIVIPLANI